MPVNAKLTVVLFEVILLLALKLLASTFAVTSTLAAVTVALEFTLPANRLPVKFKLVPVAAPMFGVTNTALFATAIFPPMIDVVVLSTLALITVPLIAIPLPEV